MTEDVHVRIDVSKSSKYSKLNDDLSSIFYKRGQASIFIIATCIGFYFRKRIPLPPGKGSSDLFITSTLGSGNSEKLWILKAIAISELGIDSLKDFKNAIKVCQEYANFGIDYLYDIHEKSSDEVRDYTRMMKEIVDEKLNNGN